MIAADEDALICDFAQTYHITNMQALPLETAAALAVGLDKDSRIMRSLSGGTDLSLTEMLLAACADALNLLVWTKTKDAEKGRNKPQSIMGVLMHTETKKDETIRAFDTPEEFMAAYREARKKINGD